jgi:chromosome partitioning protein
LGRIITIANQKGGVGKTTTAINLAASLAAAERRVLAIDSDPQGNLTSGLGCKSVEARPTLYNVLTEQQDCREVLVKTDLQHLHLIPSDRNLTGVDLELADVEGREFRLRQALTTIVSEYDYIFIDCPPSLGLLTINALSASQTVLIPLQCEYFALEGISELVAILGRIRRTLNPGVEIEGVLLTMVDERMNLTQQVIGEIRSHFKDRVFVTSIPRSIRLAEAPSFGKPIILYDIRSKGAEAYLDLAKEIMAHEEKGSGQGALGTHS